MKQLKTPKKKLEANKRYRLRNREAILYHKKNNRLRRFGLEPEDLDRMLKEQDYKCLVCGIGPLTREGRELLSSHLDHCHDCKKLRGVVCKRCNGLLGYIESDYDAFLKAFIFHVDHVIDEHQIKAGVDFSSEASSPSGLQNPGPLLPSGPVQTSPPYNSQLQKAREQQQRQDHEQQEALDHLSPTAHSW
jgi:hypothetical protein